MQNEVITHHFPSLGSTNVWAKEHISQLRQGQLTLVTADEQTAGYGQHGHVWNSPAGINFYGSFSFLMDPSRKDLVNITQLASVAVAEVLLTHNCNPALKWPNDILVSKKKIAGILSETTLIEQGMAVIVGIGLNVNMSKEQLSFIDQPATSLLVETGNQNDLDFFTRQITSHFLKYLTQFINSGIDSFISQYTSLLYHHPGDKVKFNHLGEIIEGSFQEITPDGFLKLLMPDQTEKIFTSGYIL